jgi:NADPH:quinone reductase-like Zn-dependent oxidoreductase
MEPQTYRHIVVSKKGGPEVLQVVEDPVPEPKAGEIRVAMQAAGVSAFDLMVRSKSLPGFPKAPFTPGCDAVGRVDAMGNGVAGFEIGDVVASPPLVDGGYSERILLPADKAVKVPPDVDPAQAVCLIANYLTSHLMMHRVAKVQAGERVLVHGAAGGVGSALLELGGLAELEMYGTASKRNHELVTKLGATPIDYRNEDFVERVRSLTGDGVDVVFDPIGGFTQLWRSYRTLRKGGRLVWFGVAAISRRGAKVIPGSLIARQLLSLIPDGRKAPLTPNAGKVDHGPVLAELLDLLKEGKLNPVIAERIPLLDASKAHELLEAGGYAGKVVLTTDA